MQKFEPLTVSLIIFNPKNCYSAVRDMGLGCRIRDAGSEKKLIPDPGLKKATDPGPATPGTGRFHTRV